MAKTAMVFGVVLMFTGIGFYLAAVPHAPTALIPLYLGIALAILGALARTEDTKRRALFMHVAVTVGLLGFLFPFIQAFPGALKMVQGVTVARPLAIEEQMVMAAVCLVLTGLCVQSFIAARRSRVA